MGWVARHKILSTVLGLFALLVFVGALAPDNTDTSSTAESPLQEQTVAATETPTPSPGGAETADQETNLPSATETTTETRETSDREPIRRRYAVLNVIDGDTVEVAYRGGESVRIIGIDTPETVHPSEPEECGGPAASRAAARILSGKRVMLVFDPTQGRRDSFGRLLAYLQVSGNGDFGLTMIKRGYAAEYTYDTDYQRKGLYQRAEGRAQAATRGIWGRCGGTDTPLRQPQPERTFDPKGRGPGTDSGSNCEPGYDPCLPPYPPDLDCGDVDGPIRVTGSDPHGLDGEGDGIACES